MQVERRNAKVSRIAQMEALSPPVDAVEALRRNIVEIYFPGGSTQDLAEVVASQKAKALAGDQKAADSYQKNALAIWRGVEARREKPGPAPVPNLHEWRINLAHVIASDGPLTDVELLHRTGGRLMYTDVLAALNHDWFERAAGKYGITADARKNCPGLSR
jgi:hypothetical protein